MPATGRFDGQAVKRQFPGLADERLHYLDNAATAQMPEAVFDAMRRFEIDARANVHGGSHRRARLAMDAYAAARARVARFLNASSDEVVFTYGATSAINLAAYAFGERLQRGDVILLSMLEHHSNLVPWQKLAERRGVVLRFLPMTEDGRIDLDRVEEEAAMGCRLVALTHCSNVTGAVTDAERVVKAARANGARVLLDGAQLAPHMPLDMRALGVDFYAFSGHKTFGPTGIGVLWGRRELLQSMPPFLTGGQMIQKVTLERATFRDAPYRFEAGTPPIAQAIGLGAALDWMLTLNWKAIREYELGLTRRLLAGLAGLSGVRVIGPTDTASRRGVVSFHVDGFTPDEVCRALDLRGLALRGGHHCAQPLFAAAGVDGAARASLAPYNTEADIDALLDALGRLVGRSDAARMTAGHAFPAQR